MFFFIGLFIEINVSSWRWKRLNKLAAILKQYANQWAQIDLYVKAIEISVSMSC